MRENLVSFPVEISLRLIGIWPGISRPTIRQLGCMLVILATQVLQYRKMLGNFATSDMGDWMEGFALTITDSIVLSRITLLWLNRCAVSDILRTMSDDWDESFATSKPRVVVMTRKAEMADRVSKLINYLLIGGAILFPLGALYSDYQLRYVGNATREGLLIAALFPVKAPVTPFKEIVFFEQYWQQIAAIMLAGSSTSFMISVVLHAAGQMDIIRRQLREIISMKANPVQVGDCLRMVIRRHQRVIQFCDNVEDIFTYIAFMVVLIVGLLFGCLCFIITMADDLLTKLLFVIYYVCVLTDLLINCETGEYLGEKSLAIGEASYECEWYELRPAECRMLLLIVLRSQKKLTVTVGKFLDLSMEVFATVLKTSISIVSLFFVVC